MATRWVTNLGEGGPGHACMLGMLRCTLCRHVLGSVCTGATRATCAHAGTPYARLWGQLSEALAGLCGGGAAAAPYVELLLQDGELCSRLLRLLLPGIRAIAIGLQLPPERRPAECNWRAAECMALLVFSTAHMLSQVMIELGPASGVHLMQAATQLLQHCPFPAAGSGQGTAGVFIGQLGAIAAAVPLRSHAVQRLPAPAKAVAAALPRQLLAVLPKVNEALAGAAQPPLLEELATPARSAASILQALCWAAKASDSVTEPAALFHEEDLPAWLLGATTALRWLPMAAAALAADARAQPRRSDPAATDLAEVWQDRMLGLVEVALLLAELVSYSGLAAVQLAEARDAEPTTAAVSECLAAWWQLDAAVCRLVHLVHAGSIAPLLRPALGEFPMTLARMMQQNLRAAVTLSDSCPAPAPPEVARRARRKSTADAQHSCKPSASSLSSSSPLKNH